MKHPVYGPGVERGGVFIYVHSKPEINEAPGLLGWMDTAAPTITRATHGSSLRTAMHGWREVPRAATILSKRTKQIYFQRVSNQRTAGKEAKEAK